MVDTGIGNRDLHFIILILLAQVMLTVGQTANEFIRNWLMLHVTSRVSISLISDFLSKLMRLPIAFFDAKRIGDILQRVGDYNRIQSFLTGSLISIVMAVITFAVYSGIMASYNLPILLIFLIGSALYVGWVMLFLKRRRKLDYMRFQEAANNQNNLVQMMALQYIIGQMNAPLAQFINFVQATQDAKMSLERLNEIQAREDEEPMGIGKRRDIPENAAIEFRDVVFQYDGPHSEKVLDHINLLIPSRKVTAVVGTSGSGKTTLLKLILGFYRPVEGSVQLGGVPIENYSDSEWRHNCGVVRCRKGIFFPTPFSRISLWRTNIPIGNACGKLSGSPISETSSSPCH